MKRNYASMDMTPELITLDDITHWAPPGSCRRLTMLRLEKIHPIVSGNKWYKLRHNVETAIGHGKNSLLTFGGGYSNHLVATAFAAREAGLASIGIVRGHYDALTPTLRTCIAYGMQLIPYTKGDFAAHSGATSLSLGIQFPHAHIIPEGGANDLGIRGASEIAAFIPIDVTDVCVAVGTGTTLAGLKAALSPEVQLHGFCAARSCDAASALLAKTATANLPIIHQVADPRFGKWKQDQIGFMVDFYFKTGIQLDVVYTAKMMMRVFEMLTTWYFARECEIVCIHTGGLQGNPSGLFG